MSAAVPATPAARDGHERSSALVRSDLEQVPQVASARAYLRAGLPAIYRSEESFGMRFLQALERVLDRHVAIVDSLAAYISPQLAPPDMVTALAGWLGLGLEETPAEPARRALLSNAARIARLRGTRAGLELALALCFPELHLEVRDFGEVVLLDDDTSPPEPYPGFEVHCREPLTAARRTEVQRAIERQRPLPVTDARLVAQDATEPQR
jgi:phage tail-like protein